MRMSAGEAIKKALIQRAGAEAPANDNSWYKGNIDLDNRVVYVDQNTGVKQTENSMSFSDGPPENPREILIPTVIDGVPVNRNTAIGHYYSTGQHLGEFSFNDWSKSNPEAGISDFYKSIDVYAKGIHERQAKRYSD
jgi:hypothetical protein